MTLSSQQYADLADFSYGRDQKGNEHIDLQSLVGKVVKMEDGTSYRILAHADKPSGYQGTIFQREDTGEIVVAHRGTEFTREPLRDGLLTDGGMVFGRVNQQAADAIALTREAQWRAEKYAHQKSVPAPEVTVTGHSLGGTLAQITAHHFDLRGEAFNPYGAASLGLRIPEEATPKFINHVMAADVVSSASPHYGQVRIYAKASEIAQLRVCGYRDGAIADALTPDNPIAASVNTSHMMHNFLNVDGNYKPDVSALSDPAARARAREHEHMIESYRSDVRAIRRGASALGDAGEMLRGPGPAVDRIRELIEPSLPAGEPARREQHRQHGASLAPGAVPLPDMRDPGHPANGRYQQAYAGVARIDQGMGRAPDGSSERLAAALTAASPHLSSIDRVGLSPDGSRAFAVEASNGPAEARQRAQVEVASAVQRPVEASTAQWQLATDQLAQSHARQQAQERANPVVRGPVMG
ncbi:XVIPCD domain-containing protein [Pseudoxanthomonas winnipegensis]|uniref:Lipase n=1 Tax=Pseudoxanthomonas winnipegensis TaxID=2480810 RepID=A0A4Q8LMZ2_9GAMM|nr:XVIPCD domain-containing protein [Pseudoxanthomonas winnipegensis]RZZ83374.1 lipase [Pseudoxanthomonas winnipegensis]TAA31627.1 lipase [Pseudoxanthomonas winnipegensis]